MKKSLAQASSNLLSKRALRVTKVLIVFATVIMVMSGGEPAYAEWCPRC